MLRFCALADYFTRTNLKSKVWNKGEEDGGYEHYLVFLKKREESRSFDVFLCLLGEKYGEKREKKNTQKTLKQLPKTQFFSSDPIWGARGYL